MGGRKIRSAPASRAGKAGALRRSGRSAPSEAATRGITITEASAEARKALEAHKASEPKLIEQSASKEGVKDPGAIIKAHLANVEKWVKIQAKIGDDQNAFTKALWDEVFSKVDPEKM